MILVPQTVSANEDISWRCRLMLFKSFLHRSQLALLRFLVDFTPPVNYLAFSGAGSADQLCGHICQAGKTRVLVVTDKGLRDLGIVEKAISGLRSRGIDIVLYDGVLPDPTFEQVLEGADIMRAHGSDAVLGVGGGSCMDAAKIIAAAATSNQDPRDWVGFNKIKHDVPQIFCIPTTSGTGAETTMGGVIKNSERREKIVISDACLMPAATALDPNLSIGLPPAITAATGMDALTHAIEAYISLWDRGTSKSSSAAAIDLIYRYLPLAYSDGDNKEARESMSLAAYYAGMAINQVNVGNVHAIAHQLGGRYGIPHGIANAMVLPHVLKFCSDETEEALAELGRLVGLGSSGSTAAELARDFIVSVSDLRNKIGIPSQSKLIKIEDHSVLAESAVKEGAGYPVRKLLDKKTAMRILEQLTI